MRLRKWLLKLAQKLELGWREVNTQPHPQGEAQHLLAGWYIAIFSIQGMLQNTPRLLLKDGRGKELERRFLGAHSGRNRTLIYLPSGELQAYSEVLEFEQLARVSTLEGRARVLLICFRYLLDFFGLRAFIRSIVIQFQNPLVLSNELMQFYASGLGGENHLTELQHWDRYRGYGNYLGWWYRDIKLAVLIEDESQRQDLLDLLLPPDQIILLAAAKSGSIDADFDYLIPLSKEESLRYPAILLIKKAIHAAKRQSGSHEPILLYTDHDYKEDEEQGEQALLPVFKPEPSLAYLHCFNYIGPSVVYSKAVISEFEFAQLFDPAIQYQLAINCFTKSEQVVHIDKVLFQSRADNLLKTPAPNNADSAWKNISWIRSSEVRQGQNGLHNQLIASQSWLQSNEKPSVDLVVPTRDGLEFLKPCVDGLLTNTDYPNFHIFIVDNGSELTETKAYLQAISSDNRVTVLDYPGEFNYSAINNFAISQGKSDYIGLINNDIEVIHTDWLNQMMAWATQAEVGVVGAKLLFGNGKVQHAGVTIGMGNAAGHIHRLEEGDASGYQDRCVATQNMMAVTAACLITPRQIFEQMGGLDEQQLAVAYNDIDYCLKVEQSGLQVIWTPEARLYHHESVTRGDDMSEQHIDRYFKELSTFQKRWKTKGFVDKYYSRHLRIGDEGVFPRLERSSDDPLRYMV